MCFQYGINGGSQHLQSGLTLRQRLSPGRFKTRASQNVPPSSTSEISDFKHNRLEDWLKQAQSLMSIVVTDALQLDNTLRQLTVSSALSL